MDAGPQRVNPRSNQLASARRFLVYTVSSHPISDHTLPKLFPCCALLATLPLATGCDARPPVLINEFMADNETTLADGASGEYLDWIELINTGDEVVSLDGMYLTDDLDGPTQHPLDSRLTISPGGFLVLWASKKAVNDPTHLNFALAAGGEDLGLFWLDPDSGNLVMLDGLVYSAQEPDISMARDEDGTGAWMLTQQPSPGASNQ